MSKRTALKGPALNRPSSMVFGYVRGAVVLFAFASALALAAPQSDEGRKLALIVAISDYGDPGLNPVTGEPMGR